MKQNQKLCLKSIGLMLAASLATAQASTIWYVNGNVKKDGDGTSWGKALSSLQTALKKAESGDQIWVAAGTYYPAVSDRKISFKLKQGVELYGGFKGFESQLSMRDYEHNLTILSGNIGKGNPKKNSITVVIGANNAVLDGFTIRDAYSSATPQLHLTPQEVAKGTMPSGGGLRNFFTSPIVRNVVFTNNYAAKGGGVYNLQESMTTQAKFINVKFINNTAQLRGGGVSNDLGSMPTFINCQFINNKSLDKGGGIYNDFGSSPKFYNVLIESNSAITAGGMGNDGTSSPLLVNTTIINNQALSNMGADLYQGTGTNNNPLLINSIVRQTYNWHEDIVAEYNSQVAANQSIPLKTFITKSNLASVIGIKDLELFNDSVVGYSDSFSLSQIESSSLITKLESFYNQYKGSVLYQDEYQRPLLSVKPNQLSIIYVASSSNAKLHDGRSWATPMTDLQQAINQAAVNHAQVWVKAGTYKANYNQKQIAAFILYDNVKIYGGFSGKESAATERDITVNPTIISAKALDKAGFNYPHTVYGANNVVLDGITIADGQALGSTYNGNGGGLIAYPAGKMFTPFESAIGYVMTLNNCRFVNNEAENGGAIYAYGKAKITMNKVSFESNHAVYGGAIMDREGNQLNCNSCTFVNNSASQDGGAVYIDYGSHAIYQNSQFNGNIAKHSGGAFFSIDRASQLGSTKLEVINSKLIGNKAPTGANLDGFDGAINTFINTPLAKGSYTGNTKFSQK